MCDTTKLWEEISIDTREALQDHLERYYGTLGSFDGWTLGNVLSLVEAMPGHLEDSFWWIYKGDSRS